MNKFYRCISWISQETWWHIFETTIKTNFVSTESGYAVSVNLQFELYLQSIRFFLCIFLSNYQLSSTHSDHHWAVIMFILPYTWLLWDFHWFYQHTSSLWKICIEQLVENSRIVALLIKISVLKTVRNLNFVERKAYKFHKSSHWIQKIFPGFKFLFLLVYSLFTHLYQSSQIKYFYEKDEGSNKSSQSRWL
jgi:hypothetical protein